MAINTITGSNSSASTDYVLDASSKDVAATITAAPLTSTASIGGTLSKTYDGTTNAPGASVSGTVSGAVSGDTLALDTSAVSLAYNSAHVVSANSIAASGTAGFTIAASTAGSVASDYSFTAPSIAPATGATITPATLTTTLSNTGVSKTYDGTTASAIVPTYNITGYVSGDSAATLSYSAAQYDSAHVANATKVTVSGLAINTITGSNSSASTDYVLDASSKDVAATITAAPLISTASIGGTLSKTYDGTTNAPGASVSGTVSGAVSGDTLALDTSAVSLAYNSAHVVSANSIAASGTAGFTIAASTAGSVASDYSFTAPSIAPATGATITPATLNVAANSDSKTFNGLAYAGGNGVVYSGFVNNETAAVLGGTLAYVGNSQGALNAGSYLITPNGLSSSDYAMNYTSGALVISPVALSTIMGGLTGSTSKVYDGSNSATMASDNFAFAGWIGSDGASVTKTTGVFDTANAGTGKTVTVSLAGSDFAATGNTVLGNYVLPTSVSGVIGVITKAPLSASVVASNKVYDGSTVAASTLVITGGLVGSETVGASASASFNSKDVLTANLVTVNSTALSNGTNGGLASNYSLVAGETVAASITPALLSASVSAPNKVYDGTTTATPTLTITGGLVGSETVNVSSTGSFNSKDVLTANRVTVDSSVLSNGTNGGLASNYYLPVGQTVAAAIGKATLTVSADNKSKSAGQVNPPLTVSVSGFVNGESPSSAEGYTGVGAASTSATTETPAGTAVIVANAGTLQADNYAFTNLLDGKLLISVVPPTMPEASLDGVPSADISVPNGSFSSLTSAPSGPSLNEDILKN